MTEWKQLIVLAVALFVWTASGESFAQSTVPTEQKQTGPILEISSVKTNPSGGTSMSFSTEANGFKAENVTVLFLLINGYGVRDDQVFHVPEWARQKRYDILVKASGTASPQGMSSEEQQTLIRQLLAIRFNVKAHYEVREAPVLYLVIGKGGVKMAKLPANVPASRAVLQNRGSIYGQAMTMPALANQLSSVTEIEVVDRTSLEGAYLIDLKWSPDDTPAAASTSDDVLPPLYTAIQSELGLKLVSGKANVNVLSVDQVHRPEPN